MSPGPLPEVSGLLRRPASAALGTSVVATSSVFRYLHHKSSSE